MTAIVAHASSIKIPGTSTAFTDEPCTVTTGTTFQINTAAKRVLDPSVPVVVEDGGVPVVCTGVDFLFGKVTLAGTPGGAVTVNASYLPMIDVLNVVDFNVKASATILDTTDFKDSTGYKKRTVGMVDVSGSLSTQTQKYADQDTGGGAKTPVGYLDGSYHGGTVMLELWPAGTSDYFRAWCILESLEDKGATDGLQELGWSFTGCSREGTVGSTSLRAGVSFGWGP